ncbi:MAG: PEGA domain-containing protein, partial [Crenarchaeota archaeon]|nr:PEGA domain-containing protein [Thermoproteota archaeon]
MKTEHFESAELSDVGKKRKNNEDACLRIPEKGVFLVADGMGGVAGGELASEAIVKSVQKVYAKAASEQCSTLRGLIGLFEQGVNRASKWIKELADEKLVRGMGSTVVGLVMDPRQPTRAMALHAGDSRLYRFRNNELKQLTADHTTAAELAKALNRSEQSFRKEFQNELSRAVGLKERAELEQTPVEVQSGDVFMLCSDGLPRMVSDKQISELLAQHVQDSAEVAAKVLIEAANKAGGNDNITVILIKLGDVSVVDKEAGSVEDGEASPTIVPTIAPSDTLLSAAAPVESHDTPQTPRTSETPDTPSDKTPDTDRDSVTIEPAITPPPSVASSSATEKVAEPVGAAEPREEEHEQPVKEETPPVGLPQERGVDGGRRRLVAQAYRRKAGAIAVAAIAVAFGAYWMSRTPGTKPVTPTPPSLPEVSLSTNDVSKVIPESIVKIDSEPSKAHVFVEGKRIGQTPCIITNVTEGEVTYTLGTPAHTGSVTLAMAFNKTIETKVPLKPRQSDLQVSSKPSEAEIWSDGQKLGITPTNFLLTVNRYELVLKKEGLDDVALSLQVMADQPINTNVTFAHGAVILRSEPSGRIFATDGKHVGDTPYTNLMMKPGSFVWQVIADNYERTNVIVHVSNKGEQTVMDIKLQRGKGQLQLGANVAGVKAHWGDTHFNSLPTNVAVVAGKKYQVVAEYMGQLKTNSVEVAMDDDKVLTFTFEEIKKPEPRPIPTIKPTVKLPERQEQTLVWTNNMGMVFLKPAKWPFWVGTTRVTAEQYAQVAGGLGNCVESKDDGPPCVTNVSYADANSFAKSLTERLKQKNDLPAGCGSWRFTLPTASQWIKFANFAYTSEGLHVSLRELTKYGELCIPETAQDKYVRGEYSLMG